MSESEIIEGLLCSAIEGGSNYWYCISNDNMNEIPECDFLSSLLTHKKGWLLIEDAADEDAFEPKKITNDDLLKGWKLFSTNKDYKSHYDDAMNENDDATTGDVFFQFVVFNEVIFG